MIVGKSSITKPTTVCLGLVVVLFSACQNSTETMPGVVTGDSMAPTLMGKHYQTECADCGIRFRFRELEDGRLTAEVVCPNCGWEIKTAQHSESFSIGEPDQVIIEPGAKIARWDLVAFQLPETSSQDNGIGIKRVVGMPGETIEIRGGDLYADGVLLRKNVETQPASRILVYDSLFFPASKLPNRIRPMSKKSKWIFENGLWRFADEPRSAVDNRNFSELDLDWLVYHHWRCCSHVGARDEEFPIEDYYGFNQGLARNLNYATDLSLEATVKLGDAQFGWRYQDGSRSFECCVDGADNTLSINRLDTTSWRMAESETVTIRFSVCDGQLRVGSSREQELENEFKYEIDPSEERPTPFQPPLHGLQFGAAGGKVEIERIRIWRDIHYFPVSEKSRVLAAGPDGYVLLGDNVPLSIDSRHWHSVSIDRDAILGRVKTKK